MDIKGPDLNKFDSGGRVTTLNGAQKIARNLETILLTPKGSRVNLPEFGSNLYLLQFEPFSSIMQDLLVIYIKEAIEMSEPRVQILNISVDTSNLVDKVIACTIDFAVKESTIAGSFRYDFRSVRV
jgi:phage baseplate assembly protein W